MPTQPIVQDSVNLMVSPPSASELADLLSQMPPQSVLPPFGSDQWAEVFRRPLPAKRGKVIRELALQEADMPLPELTDEMYSAFSRTGDRLRFETTYYARQKMLARAALALLRDSQPPAPALLRSFLSKLETLLDDVSWALPAHVGDPSGRNPQVIDLFSAELTNTVAECLVIFGGLIPAPLQERIRQRLAREFNNYLQRDYWWLRITNNWCAVCNQGIAGAALTALQEPQQLAAILLKAADSLKAFIDGFGEDGACVEGPSYWDYGFGWFAYLNAQLEARSNGRLTLFGDTPKLQRIASYGPAMTLADGSLINFSDAGKAPLRPSTLLYLGQRLNNEACLHLGKANYSRMLSQPYNLDRNQPLLQSLLRLFLYAPAAEDSAADACDDGTTPHTPATAAAEACTHKAAHTADAVVSAGHPPVHTATADSGKCCAHAALPDKNALFPDFGVWAVSRRDSYGNLWELAAKAGHNGEHHNHNDVGSFILSVNCVPLLTEIGMPEYNKAYFSPARYECMAANSVGHSLPVLCGQPQCDGEASRGTILHADTSGSAPAFSADITAAYPTQANCRHFTRTLQLDSGAGLCRLNDSIRLAAPGQIESGFITDAEDVSIASASLASITKDGIRLKLQCDSGSRWERIDTLHYNNHAGTPVQCLRLILKPAAAGAVTEWENSVEFTLFPTA